MMSPTHVHMHAHTCIHTHVHTYDIIRNSQGFPRWGLPFAIEIIMFNVYMCMYVHACMCMCVHVCGGTPNHPPPPYTHPSTPRAAGSPKNQNSISPELIEII